jgi:hypothetical protein
MALGAPATMRGADTGPPQTLANVKSIRYGDERLRGRSGAEAELLELSDFQIDDVGYRTGEGRVVRAHAGDDTK